MMARIVFAAIAAAVIGLASSGAALACKCAVRDDVNVDELFAGYDVIFTGTAIKAVPAGRDKRSPFSLTTFKVTESFKGAKAGQTIVIRHRSGSPGACGFSFELNQPHTVPAMKLDGDLTASQCSRLIFRGEKSAGILERLRARPR